MKGATIEPWAKTNKAPSTTITIMIGASQSFLRERKKNHISFKNDTIIHSKLIFERLCRGDVLVTINPIRVNCLSL